MAEKGAFDMEQRLRLLRKQLGLTQEEFAERLGIKRSAISNYEIGRNTPIDAVISLICREFSVSESWLRTGEGEMFRQRCRHEEIAAFLSEILVEEPAGFRLRMVSALSRLNPAQWTALESVLTELTKELADESAPVDTRPRSEKPVTEWTEEEINAEAEEYRQSLLEEKRRGESGSASAGPNSSDTA